MRRREAGSRTNWATVPVYPPGSFGEIPLLPGFTVGYRAKFVYPLGLDVNSSLLRGYGCRLGFARADSFFPKTLL
jgi:hypothetical protein